MNEDTDRARVPAYPARKLKLLRIRTGEFFPASRPLKEHHATLQHIRFRSFRYRFLILECKRSMRFTQLHQYGPRDASLSNSLDVLSDARSRACVGASSFGGSHDSLHERLQSTCASELYRPASSTLTDNACTQPGAAVSSVLHSSIGGEYAQPSDLR